MTRLTLDYLTVTIRPDRVSDGASVVMLQKLLCEIFHLDGYLDKFQFVGRARHYIAIYRYNDISLKICAEDRLYTQGLCLEMSGNGLAHWIKSLPKGVTVQDVFRAFRSLSTCGFKVNVPRFDVALDDIAYGLEKPLLHMSTIAKKWANHEFCSRSQANANETKLDFKSADEGFFKVGRQTVNKKRGTMGHTVYFGNRKSPVYVRFYDKKAEQLQQGLSVDENINSWVRCEYEYHNIKAIAVMTLFIENDYADFVQKYKATVMGHLRFINADDSNRSRCSTCSWWVSFLETLTGSKLSSGPVKTVQFRKTLQWFNHSVAPTFWGLTACLGIEFLTCLHETGRSKIKERQLQLIEDYMNNRDGVDKECPNLWAFFASAVCGGYQEALDRLKKDSIYINNIPSCMDKREWLNMVFADCEGVSV